MQNNVTIKPVANPWLVSHSFSSPTHSYVCRNYTVSAQSHKTDSRTHAGIASLYTPSRTFAYTQRGTRPQKAHSLPNRDNSSYFTTDGFLPQLSDIAFWQHDRNKALPALLTACILCLRRYSALSLHAWFYSARAHVCGWMKWGRDWSWLLWLLQSAKKAKPSWNASADKTFTAWTCIAAVSDRISYFFPPLY